MKAMLLAVSLVLTTVLFATTPTLAGEYYVIKSRSGIVRIVDHRPKGGATIVKGPFKTSQEAEKAMGSGSGTKAPGTGAK